MRLPYSHLSAEDKILRLQNIPSELNVKVKVRFYASLRDRIGVEERILNLKGDSGFYSLIKELGCSIGERINLIINGSGSIRDDIMISVNNRLIDHSSLKKLRLNDGDQVDIMPLPSGG